MKREVGLIDQRRLRQLMSQTRSFALQCGEQQQSKDTVVVRNKAEFLLLNIQRGEKAY